MNYVGTMATLKMHGVRGDMLQGCSDAIKLIVEMERIHGPSVTPSVQPGYAPGGITGVRFEFTVFDHQVVMIVGKEGEAELLIRAISPATVGAYLCTICQEEEPLLTENQWNPLNQRRIELIRMENRTDEQTRELASLQRVLEIYLRPLDNKLMEGLATLEQRITENQDDPGSNQQPNPETGL